MQDTLENVISSAPLAGGAGVAGSVPDVSLPSLPESYRSVGVPTGATFLRRMLAFAGPGYLIAVGYMDPGNWATDVAGGSQFGYTLLSVVLLSSLMAMFLQALCVKLGVATGRDLAQACRDNYSRPTAIALWIGGEIAIAACDLAEVLGSAVALQLLFGIPLLWGVLITTFDVLLILLLQGRGFRWIEAFVVSLIGVIGLCFAYELLHARPIWGAAIAGLVPSPEILHNGAMLYIAIGILGATVMPHNLYLHSSLVQTRSYPLDAAGKREAIRFGILDSSLALGFSFFINAAILVLGAAAFHVRGMHNVAEIGDAYKLLSPVLGASLASTLFAVALLASGQNSTLTGTLAGQVVMEGFLRFRMKPWMRRLVTRLAAVVPAALVIGLMGANRVTALLILSQVILSLQLPFAVIPLVQFTSDRGKMGEFVNRPGTVALAWFTSAAIVVLNALLLWQIYRGV
ncbi:MAG TPA: Nramp family divalent metal transporter [Patescibacteria group bacterium]|nr:Nramp family divalent metal transporter [Patescibacteria group bacterium]